jgi:hypothetical protein
LATVNDRFKVKNGLNIAVPDGVEPIITDSQTLNENLNADLLDGEHGEFYINTSDETQTKIGSLVIDVDNEEDALKIIQVGEGNAFVVEDDSEDSSRFIITNSGDVGVGTNEPNTKVHIVGEITVEGENGTAVFKETSIEIGEARTSNGDAFIDLHSTDGSDFETRILRESGADGDLIIDNAGTGSHIFKLDDSEKMRLTSDGNLGLGINPNSSARLHVRNDQDGTSDFILRNADDGEEAHTALRISNDVSDTSHSIVVNSSSAENNGGPNSLNIINSTESPITISTDNTERLRVSADGKIGINESDPQYSLDVDGDANITSNLTVGGNLTVNGTTTTINSIVSSINDPVILLGGELPPEEDDSKDRGVEFRWHDGDEDKIGFFGFDRSTGRFTYIPDAQNDGEIFAGDVGGLDADHIQFDTSPNASMSVGRFLWDDTKGTIDLGLKGGNVTLRLGQEQVIRVHNGSVANISAGDVVEVVGVSNGFFSVQKAVASSGASPQIIMGVAAENITIGNQGFITRHGIVNNLDTFVDGVSEGFEIWLSDTTPGAWSLTRPNPPSKAIRIGYLQKENSTDGRVFVDISVSTGDFATLHDVNIEYPISNWDVMYYDDETSTWKNTDISTIVNSIETINAQNIVVSGDLTVETNVFIEGDLDVDGDINIDGGDLTASTETFNLLNSTVDTINMGGAAETINLGSETSLVNINNNLEIDGNELSSASETFTLLDQSTTVNFATSATSIEIGSSTGTTNVNNDLDVDGDLNVDGGDFTTSATTFNLLNNTATTVNFAGAATTIEIGSNSGTTNINNDLDVDGDVNIDGGDLTVSTSTFNLANTTATTVNFAGAATDVQIGSSTGTTDINNNLNVSGNLLSTTSSTFTALDTPTTVAFAGAATSLSVGAATGITNVRNNLEVDGDVQVDGGDLTASTTTFNLINTTSTTVNFAGAGTSVNIGATSGTTNIKNNLDVDLDINVDGGDITTSASTFNLLNTVADVINFGGAATIIEIGSSTGTTNINNSLDVDGDINIDGGDITASTSTFNLLNSPTTINFGTSATTLEIGSASGTTNINNNLDVDGDINIDGGDITASTTTFNLLNSVVQTLNIAGSSTAVSIGANTGKTIIKHALQVDGNTEFFGATNTFSPPTVSPPFVLGANALNQRVTGLNSDLLDNQDGTWYQARENHTGTQTSSTISNFADTTQQTVAPMFVHSQHSNLTATYNNVSKRIILSATGGGGSSGGSNFSLTYWMGV